jgi:PAS domain S-box-containing protein
MISAELVRSVLDSAPDAMIIIDSSGLILFANKQVEALFGYRREDLLGEAIETLLPERFRARHVGHRDSFVSRPRVRPMGAGLELFGRRADGSEFPVEISLSPITLEGDTVVAAAIRDATERKIAERALQDARREADQANLAKSRFLATASHDLRQPLQTLGLLTGALRRMVKDPDAVDVVTQQETAIDAMSRLLNALLDVSKLESGAVRANPVNFDVAALFDDMRREYGSVAAAKGLAFSIDTQPEAACADPALVGQMLRNLISNAIKYTERGRVELRCAHDGEDLRIEVRDSGIGIPPDQLGCIFDEFYQVGVAPNSSRNGYGLGLSIVQRIARLIGAGIKVDSKPGEGSVFSFKLPRARGDAVAPSTQAAERETATGGGGGALVLLVEDEPGVRNAMRVLLELDGYEIAVAATFEEAQSLIEGARFDLIVTDYHLDHGHTGLEVIAAARAAQKDDVEAILVTGDTSPAVRETRDAHVHITSKPINPDELLRLAKRLSAR